MISRLPAPFRPCMLRMLLPACNEDVQWNFSAADFL